MSTFYFLTPATVFTAWRLLPSVILLIPPKWGNLDSLFSCTQKPCSTVYTKRVELQGTAASPFKSPDHRIPVFSYVVSCGEPLLQSLTIPVSPWSHAECRRSLQSSSQLCISVNVSAWICSFVNEPSQTDRRASENQQVLCSHISLNDNMFQNVISNLQACIPLCYVLFEEEQAAGVGTLASAVEHHMCTEHARQLNPFPCPSCWWHMHPSERCTEKSSAPAPQRWQAAQLRDQEVLLGFITEGTIIGQDRFYKQIL